MLELLFVPNYLTGNTYGDKTAENASHSMVRLEMHIDGVWLRLVVGLAETTVVFRTVCSATRCNFNDPDFTHLHIAPAVIGRSTSQIMTQFMMPRKATDIWVSGEAVR